jgi:hypothetical protein
VDLDAGRLKLTAVASAGSILICSAEELMPSLQKLLGVNLHDARQAAKLALIDPRLWR